ncbi:MAG: hypothetical protein KIS81_08065 [Maricaulaceae bacterium]|nr:hypothetical protein [Maricaulaceae bacterium]
MIALSPELLTAAISAAAALVLGGAVALLGFRPVASAAFAALRFGLSRRPMTSITLGLLALAGVAGAQGMGLEPPGLWS